jgi:putative transposase
LILTLIAVLFFAMPDYRRLYHPGGTYFFTLVTFDRNAILITDLARNCLRAAIQECRRTRPFEIPAIVLLPDHLHCVWTLPDGDEDYSTRISFIKAHFTRQWRANGGLEGVRSASRVREERSIWQRRFWEHTITSQDDFNQHLDYIHYNPVKHGLVSCPHQWPHSSFTRWVEQDGYEANWQCTCGGEKPRPPEFGKIDEQSE